MAGCRTLLALGILTLTCSWVLAQKPPAVPAVDPNAARLEQTSADLGTPVLSVAAASKAGLLAAGCDNGGLHFWTTTPGQPFKVASSKGRAPAGHSAAILAVAAGGPTLASASAEGSLLVWGAPAEKPLHALKAGQPIRALVLSSDGKTVAAGADDGKVHLWSCANGQALGQWEASPDWLLAAAFSGDGKILAAGGFDGKLHLLDAASGKKIADTALPAPPPGSGGPTCITALAFSPDNKLVAAGGTDAQIHLFEAKDGKLARSLKGHTSTVTSLLFHPSGNTLISGSKDRTIRLWNPASAQMLKALEGHTAWVQGIALLDPARIASAGADHTVRIWLLSNPPPAR